MESSSLFNNFNSVKPTEKLFILAVLLSCLFSVYWVMHIVLEALYSFTLSIITSIFLFIYLKKYVNNKEKWLKKEVLSLIIVLILITHLPTFFLGTARITYKLELKDASLIRVDTFLLGWIFPKGQIALYLDSHSVFGPDKPLGELWNSMLQIFYFGYYIVPYYSIYILCVSRCGREIMYRVRNQGYTSNTYDSNWRNLFFMVGVYNITYVGVFLGNTLVPASSPRLFLENEFKTPLKLNGFAGVINSTFKDNKSANSFPSGHVAESLCFYFVLLVMKEKTKSYIVLICSVFIALATIVLRYHYFADVWCGMWISFFAFVFCYVIAYKKELECEGKGNSNSNNNNNSVNDNVGKQVTTITQGKPIEMNNVHQVNVV